MLHIYLDSLARLQQNCDFIEFPMAYFKGVWQGYWLEDDFGRAVISEIDRIQLFTGQSTAQAILLSGMRVDDLCTGTKNLLLCKHADKLNRMAMMGENCYKFLVEAAKDKDVYVAAESFYLFTDSDFQGQKVHFMNTNTLVSTAREFAEQMYDAEGSGVFDRAC